MTLAAIRASFEERRLAFAREQAAIFKEKFGDGRYAYHYEPEHVRFMDRVEGRVLWRGPHRFAHHLDSKFENHGYNSSRLIGALYRQHGEMLGWCQRNISGKEGFGKRSSWCRSGYQFIFRHEEDAMMFKMRWGYFSFLSSSSSEA